MQKLLQVKIWQAEIQFKREEEEKYSLLVVTYRLQLIPVHWGQIHTQSAFLKRSSLLTHYSALLGYIATIYQ
jgi:hypothetical protein